MSKGNREFISSIPGVELETKHYITMGYECVKIKNMILKRCHDEKLPADIIEEVVQDVCDNYPNYDLIQKIMRSKIIDDIESDDIKYYLFDEDNKDITRIAPDKLKSLFSRKFRIKDKIYTASMMYRPDKPKILFKQENGPWVFNTYKPPFWYSEEFYSYGKIKTPVVEKIPELYHKFLNHLVGGNLDSYNYVLDWLATAVQSRNHCMLCTIGAKGIGKGVLGTIMRNVVGDSNFSLTTNRIVKSTFNSQIKDKKIVYCDELTISNTNEEDQLKLLINDQIEIEQKGIDAKVCKNFANIYLSSNNLDAIQISGDNRRFSIVDLTDVKLMNVMTKDEIDTVCEDKNLVSEFASYLKYRKVDPDRMLKVFESSRTDEVRLNGLKDWEYWLLFEYSANLESRKVLLKELTQRVIDKYGNIKPGYTAMRKLQNKYPEMLKITQPRDPKTNTRSYMVEFL